mmetsp:Transcript_13542/g.18744  ORF Transcript_13542/g.18744 Transcript_13542/m.18744 type:complete len:338 (-) Transcript_13542:139-1152(-)|eukprot:CAMPEP_0185267372 /NCGR_PEP_ID=MMETSP1359-20130426/34194_1 /TAXON_ID=552665 /ORGANISM="Bigelowiella longifila, Strain CCMP242" /LENGTH=337 /DNA_ID=CAMNT_0027857703 /DNA_START=44 /DNA_END=1057 /DNA_ORIENTATION=+
MKRKHEEEEVENPSEEDPEDSEEESDSRKKKKKKDHKKKDKKKKKKKDKDKKKKARKDDNGDREIKKLVELGKKMREKFPNWKPISKKDYFNKSTEFRVWLQARKKFLDDLSREKTNKLFEKFTSKWNSGSLPDNLYEGINRTQLESSALTKHKWSFVKKLGDKEKFELARLRDDVDTDNQRQSFQANALTRTCDLPVSSRGKTGPMRKQETPYDREMRRKTEKKERRDYQKHKDMVMEELVPKATGREALIEKRKQKGAYARAGAQRDDSVAAVPDSQLMGGSSDFHAAVARRNAYRAKKQQEKSLRLEQAKLNEKARMQNFLQSMGLQDKYKLQN